MTEKGNELLARQKETEAAQREAELRNNDPYELDRDMELVDSMAARDAVSLGPNIAKVGATMPEEDLQAFEERERQKELGLLEEDIFGNWVPTGTYASRPPTRGEAKLAHSLRADERGQKILHTIPAAAHGAVAPIYNFMERNTSAAGDLLVVESEMNKSKFEQMGYQWLANNGMSPEQLQEIRNNQKKWLWQMKVERPKYYKTIGYPSIYSGEELDDDILSSPFIQAVRPWYESQVGQADAHELKWYMDSFDEARSVHQQADYPGDSHAVKIFNETNKMQESLRATDPNYLQVIGHDFAGMRDGTYQLLGNLIGTTMGEQPVDIGEPGTLKHAYWSGMSKDVARHYDEAKEVGGSMTSGLLGIMMAMKEDPNILVEKPLLLSAIVLPTAIKTAKAYKRGKLNVDINRQIRDARLKDPVFDKLMSKLGELADDVDLPDLAMEGLGNKAAQILGEPGQKGGSPFSKFFEGIDREMPSVRGRKASVREPWQTVSGAGKVTDVKSYTAGSLRPMMIGKDFAPAVIKSGLVGLILGVPVEAAGAGTLSTTLSGYLRKYKWWRGIAKSIQRKYHHTDVDAATAQGFAQLSQKHADLGSATGQVRGAALDQMRKTPDGSVPVRAGDPIKFEVQDGTVGRAQAGSTKMTEPASPAQKGGEAAVPVEAVEAAEPVRVPTWEWDADPVQESVILNQDAPLPLDSSPIEAAPIESVSPVHMPSKSRKPGQIGMPDSYDMPIGGNLEVPVVNTVGANRAARFEAIANITDAAEALRNPLKKERDAAYENLKRTDRNRAMFAKSEFARTRAKHDATFGRLSAEIHDLEVLLEQIDMSESSLVDGLGKKEVGSAKVESNRSSIGEALVAADEMMGDAQREAAQYENGMYGEVELFKSLMIEAAEVIGDEKAAAIVSDTTGTKGYHRTIDKLKQEFGEADVNRAMSQSTDGHMGLTLDGAIIGKDSPLGRLASGEAPTRKQQKLAEAASWAERDRPLPRDPDQPIVVEGATMFEGPFEAADANARSGFSNPDRISFGELSSREGRDTLALQQELGWRHPFAKDRAPLKLEGKSKYLAKDQAKSDRANRFIGAGGAKSSTAAYAQSWLDSYGEGAAELIRDPYRTTDKVFVSVEGARKGRTPFSAIEGEVQRAVDAGATIITDVLKDRKRRYNVGEREAATFLKEAGYVEYAMGEWSPGTEWASAAEAAASGPATVVHFGKKKNSVLSNLFTPPYSRVRVRGKSFRTAEGAYQAHKSGKYKKGYEGLSGPAANKKGKGQKVNQKTNLALMEEIVRSRLSDPMFRDALLDTQETILHPVADPFWAKEYPAILDKLRREEGWTPKPAEPVAPAKAPIAASLEVLQKNEAGFKAKASRIRRERKELNKQLKSAKDSVTRAEAASGVAPNQSGTWMFDRGQARSKAQQARGPLSERVSDIQAQIKENKRQNRENNKSRKLNKADLAAKEEAIAAPAKAAAEAKRLAEEAAKAEAKKAKAEAKKAKAEAKRLAKEAAEEEQAGLYDNEFMDLMRGEREASLRKISRKKTITVDDLREHPDVIFLFGDNLQKKGRGGQAKEMRGEPNAIGIPTKKKPTRAKDAYFKDSEFAENKAAIDAAFDRIPVQKGVLGVVVPSAGIGTGLSQLKTRAPNTFKYINHKLAELVDASAAWPEWQQLFYDKVERAREAKAEAFRAKAKPIGGAAKATPIAAKATPITAKAKPITAKATPIGAASKAKPIGGPAKKAAPAMGRKEIGAPEAFEREAKSVLAGPAKTRSGAAYSLAKKIAKSDVPLSESAPLLRKLAMEGISENFKFGSMSKGKSIFRNVREEVLAMARGELSGQVLPKTKPSGRRAIGMVDKVMKELAKATEKGDLSTELNVMRKLAKDLESDIARGGAAVPGPKVRKLTDSNRSVDGRTQRKTTGSGSPGADEARRISQMKKQGERMEKLEVGAHRRADAARLQTAIKTLEKAEKRAQETGKKADIDNLRRMEEVVDDFRRSSAEANVEFSKTGPRRRVMELELLDDDTLQRSGMKEVIDQLELVKDKVKVLEAEASWTPGTREHATIQHLENVLEGSESPRKISGQGRELVTEIRTALKRAEEFERLGSWRHPVHGPIARWVDIVDGKAVVNFRHLRARVEALAESQHSLTDRGLKVKALIPPAERVAFESMIDLLEARQMDHTTSAGILGETRVASAAEIALAKQPLEVLSISKGAAKAEPIGTGIAGGIKDYPYIDPPLINHRFKKTLKRLADKTADLRMSRKQQAFEANLYSLLESGEAMILSEAIKKDVVSGAVEAVKKDTTLSASDTAALEQALGEHLRVNERLFRAKHGELPTVHAAGVLQSVLPAFEYLGANKEVLSKVDLRGILKETLASLPEEGLTQAQMQATTRLTELFHGEAAAHKLRHATAQMLKNAGLSEMGSGPLKDIGARLVEDRMLAKNGMMARLPHFKWESFKDPMTLIKPQEIAESIRANADSIIDGMNKKLAEAGKQPLDKADMKRYFGENYSKTKRIDSASEVGEFLRSLEEDYLTLEQAAKEDGSKVLGHLKDAFPDLYEIMEEAKRDPFKRQAAQDPLLGRESTVAHELSNMYFHRDWLDSHAFDARVGENMKLLHNQMIMHAKQNVTALAGLTTLSNMISHTTGIGLLTGEMPTTIAGRIVATGNMMRKFVDDPTPFYAKAKTDPKVARTVDNMAAIRDHSNWAQLDQLSTEVVLKPDETFATKEKGNLAAAKRFVKAGWKGYQKVHVEPRKAFYQAGDNWPRLAEMLRNMEELQDTVLDKMTVGIPTQIRTTPHNKVVIRKLPDGTFEFPNGKLLGDGIPADKASIAQLSVSYAAQKTAHYIPNFKNVPRFVKEVRAPASGWAMLSGIFSPFIAFPWLMMDLPGKKGYFSGTILDGLFDDSITTVDPAVLKAQLRNDSKKSLRVSGLLMALGQHREEDYPEISDMGTYTTQAPGLNPNLIRHGSRPGTVRALKTRNANAGEPTLNAINFVAALAGAVNFDETPDLSAEGERYREASETGSLTHSAALTALNLTGTFGRELITSTSTWGSEKGLQDTIRLALAPVIGADAANIVMTALPYYGAMDLKAPGSKFGQAIKEEEKARAHAYGDPKKPDTSKSIQWAQFTERDKDNLLTDAAIGAITGLRFRVLTSDLSRGLIARKESVKKEVNNQVDRMLSGLEGMITGKDLAPEDKDTVYDSVEAKAKSLVAKKYVGELRRYYRNHFKLLSDYRYRKQRVLDDTKLPHLMALGRDKELIRIGEAIAASRKMMPGMKRKIRRARRDIPELAKKRAQAIREAQIRSRAAGRLR